MPLLYSRTGVVYGTATFMLGDCGLCTHRCSTRLSVPSFSHLAKIVNMCHGTFDIQFSKTEVYCAYNVLHIMTSTNGNIFRVTGLLGGEFTGHRWIPRTKAMTRSFDIFFDLHMNRQLSKQWKRWWFETLPRSLWRHCNETYWRDISASDKNSEMLSRGSFASLLVRNNTSNSSIGFPVDRFPFAFITDMLLFFIPKLK